MTRFVVEILSPAEAEIREAFLWYFERSPLAASAFRSEALEAIDALGDSADRWPADEDDIRHHFLRHFPYTVHYMLERDVATVLAVGHQRRMPGYWRQR
ncbi:MAG: type II toxin-antitoxin system RelE/ParE family toxin [Gammaproteobacteria bacterium]|nr:type II toxin-antitoxin system RelE/ParE family toxin [Gammaproteobacteria bacterium]